jgi:hypothetical protein
MNDFQECRSYEMDDGVYAVNWGGVYAIAHAYAWANARLANARAITEKQVFGPDIVRFETDLNKARVQAEQRGQNLYRQFRDRLESAAAMAPSLATLQDWLKWQRIKRREYFKHYRYAVSTTQKNILRAVDRGETAVKVAQVVRDASFDTVLVLATIPVGAGGLQLGAHAWRALTAVSALKGTAKYLETGNAGSGLVTFSSSMTFGAIGMTAGGQNWIVGYLAVPMGKGAVETGTALIEGKKLKDALISGAKTVLVESTLNGVGVGLQHIARFLPLDGMEIPVNFAADKLINQGADAIVNHLQKPDAKSRGHAHMGVQYHVQRPGSTVHDVRWLRPCITDAVVNHRCLLSDETVIRSLAIVQTEPAFRSAAHQ